MIFIKDGPNIPEELLHALRNDKLVFFCGAGISKQNGLLLFDELVEKTCNKLNVHIEDEPLLKETQIQKKYDHILDMVEDSVGRKTLIEKIIETLSDYKISSFDIHKALLDLSALSNNKGHRLVTTNVDRLFHEAGLNPKLVDIGPKLVPARKRQWKNLTFLHGLIDKENDPKGNNLVLTRTDFGLAYLYDNWASRFVIQLFQEFTVLFIGYSLDDPVMQYLVSAISAENRRKNNENRKNDQNNVEKHKLNSIHAFAGYREEDQENDKQNKKEKWQSIGITPILYKIKNNEDHSLLYDSIKGWANLKRMGLNERKQWLRKKLKCEGEFPKEFQVSDREEVKSVFSFLKIDERLAEYLPQINPHISLLKLVAELPANEDTQQASKLETQSQNELKLLDSLVLSKTINRETDLLTLNTGLPIWELLSKLENSIVLWLCKNLDKKELIHWVIKHNCILNTSFKLHIQWAIERSERRREQDQKEQKSNYNNTKQKNNELDLNGKQYLFWKTIVDIHYFSKGNCSNLFRLICDLNKQYCPVKTQEFISLLEPYIGFEKALYIEELNERDKIYEPKIQINSDNYPELLTNEEVLLKHAEDFSDLLKKAMEKAKQFEIIQENSEDSFFIYRPSIEAHPQNKKFYPWIYLIDLVRDSFDLAMKEDKDLAHFLLYKWKQYPYSLFYRLILYAVTNYASLDEKYVIKLFKDSEHHILWSITCQNEVFKYLKEREHSRQSVKELESLIIQGPSRIIFKKDIDDKLVQEEIERYVCQRLNKLKSSGVQLSESTEKYHSSIQKKIENYNKQIQLKHPEIKVIPKDMLSTDDDRDDFPFWHKGVSRREIKPYHNWSAERIYNDIKHIKPNIYRDNRLLSFQSLSKDLPDKAFKVLLMFENENMNSTSYWSRFFTEIAMNNDIEKRKEYLLKSLKKIENYNNEFIEKCLNGLVYIFDYNAGLLYKNNEDYFKTWWNRLWQLSVKNIEKPGSSSDIAINALNLPLGKLSKCVLLVLWSKYSKNIPKNGKIPEDIKYYFKLIFKDTKKAPFVLYHFGIDLWILWFLDKEWILNNIQPRINWKEQVIFCRSIWDGYLHNPEWSPDFLSDFKTEFFKLFLNRKSLCKSSANNENEPLLGNIANLFFLTTGGRELENIFSDKEIKQLKKEIDIDMLIFISYQIWRLLKDTKEKSDNLWSKKFKPWVEKFWPPQENMKNNIIAERFSLAVLYAGHKLPEALNTLETYIKGNIQNNNYMITYHINTSCFDFEKDRPENRINEPHQLDYIFKYPKEILKLLAWNIPEQRADRMIEEDLKKILDKIKNEHPEIEKNEDYKTLTDKLE